MKKTILSVTLLLLCITGCKEPIDSKEATETVTTVTVPSANPPKPTTTPSKPTPPPKPALLTNQAPLANDDSTTLTSTEAKVINVLINDTDSDGSIDVSTVTIVTEAQYGITEVNTRTGEVTYHSNGSDKGEDSFSYTVQDDQDTISNVATVSLDLIVKRQSNKIEVKLPLSNWYIRLVAEDSRRGLISGSSQLGALDNDQAVEKHTLKDFAPFGGSYIDVIFRDPPGVKSGNYKVSFHRYTKNEERWNFTVRTNDAQADILLFWKGIYILQPYIDEQNRQRYKEYQSLTNPLVKNMKLIDSSNGTQIAAIVEGKIQRYQFNMNGQTERNFEWVVQTEEVNLSVKVNKLSTVKVKKQTFKRKVEVFDLNQPPLIEENK